MKISRFLVVGVFFLMISCHTQNVILVEVTNATDETLENFIYTSETSGEKLNFGSIAPGETKGKYIEYEEVGTKDVYDIQYETESRGVVEKRGGYNNNTLFLDEVKMKVTISEDGFIADFSQ